MVTPTVIFEPGLVKDGGIFTFNCQFHREIQQPMLYVQDRVSEAEVSFPIKVLTTEHVVYNQPSFNEPTDHFNGTKTENDCFVHPRGQSDG